MRSEMWLLGGALAACADKNPDRAAEDTAATPEDCGDGRDNDADELTDCEDDECLDACGADCADGDDNDGDGAADCADDECYGQGGCPGPYALSMSVELERLGWAWGYSYPFLMEHSAAIKGHGYVDVVAEPDGWEGAGFSCRGYLEGSTLEYSYAVPSPCP